ncbi:VWA domain-containing protein [Candidatus Nitrospira salsa]
MTHTSLHNNRGGFLVLGSVFVVLLFGFAALGIEAGRWFAVKAEMAKAVDAASLTGATHLTNPNIPDKVLFMQQMANANFPNGLLGTDQYTTFTVDKNDVTNKVTISGEANVLNTVSRALTYAGDSVAVQALGAARLGGAEVVLVTDISGSMSGTPVADLRDAAQQFIDNFEDTQDRSKFGLVSFATGAVVDYALQTNFHLDLTTAISGLSANGGTNTSEALAKARTNTGFTSYTTEPLNERDDQYVILISDGQPTAFRAQFAQNGYPPIHSAVVQSYTDTHSLVKTSLYDPDYRNAQFLGGSIAPLPRGDGLPIGSSSCTIPPPPAPPKVTTKWWILEDLTYGPSSASNYYAPLAGGGSEDCMDDPAASAIGGYVIQTAEKRAIDEAALIKAQNIKIYVIGFGSVNQSFLNQVSSGPNYRFYAASSSELEGLLQIIANRLKLRLLQ